MHLLQELSQYVTQLLDKRNGGLAAALSALSLRHGDDVGASSRCRCCNAYIHLREEEEKEEEEEQEDTMWRSVACASVCTFALSVFVSIEASTRARASGALLCKERV